MSHSYATAQLGCSQNSTESRDQQAESSSTYSPEPHNLSGRTVMANTSDIPSKPLNSASEITFDAGVIKDEMRTSTESPKLDIMIYHFDAARGGFEAGRCLPFDSHDVVNIYSFQRVLIDMTRTRYSMVKAVIAKEGDKGTEYRVADAARFAVLFRKTEKKAKKSRTSRSLIGVIHKVGEGSKFLDTIKYEGLPLLDRAD